MDDYYKVLGVKQFATPDEIKKAYRLLAKRWHPDCNQGKVNSAEVFKRINEAYYVLSKPTLKAGYDARLRGYLNAVKETERFYYNEKTKKEAEVNEQLHSLKTFMHKMKIAFENVIYEDENPPKILDMLCSKYRPIASVRHKVERSLNKIADLMYEDEE